MSIVYVDDVVVRGATLQEHNERLTKVLHRVRENGLKLNCAQCQFDVQERMSARGIEPDERKIKAIIDMPRPTDKKDVL